MQPVIVSLLDTDLYKLTMQAAVLDHFPTAEVEYGFTNRTPDMKLSPDAIVWLTEQIEHLGSLTFTEEERQFLHSVPALPSRYVDYLKDFRFHPQSQVIVDYDSKTRNLAIKVRGLWVDTILYEIPLLALVSEAYFRFVDTDWKLEGQQEQAADKAKQLMDGGCSFSEFGSRRRRSFETQRLVIEGIHSAATKHATGKLFAGTSNVYFAYKYGLRPIGTVAHEWMMGVAAFNHSYKDANRRAMELWIQTVGDKNAGFALTDTFGTDDFLRSFVPPLSDLYIGVRQDSGDPAEYTRLISNHYKKLGYPPMSKGIVYSDSLDVEKCLYYKKVAEENDLQASFGVGTFFTNDFKTTQTHAKSRPLNIVIKISSVNGRPAVKLSDNLGKNTGDPAEVLHVKEELGYVERQWNEGDESNRWAK